MINDYVGSTDILTITAQRIGNQDSSVIGAFTWEEVL